MDKIFIGTIEGIFGYGMSVFGHSEKECMKALRKHYDEWRKSMGNETSKKIFDEAFDYWGGSIKVIEKGVVYFDNFNS